LAVLIRGDEPNRPPPGYPCNNAIMDRIVHGSYKIALKGKSLRDEEPGAAQ
jgi:hypothetical protein